MAKSNRVTHAKLSLPETQHQAQTKVARSSDQRTAQARHQNLQTQAATSVQLQKLRSWQLKAEQAKGPVIQREVDWAASPHTENDRYAINGDGSILYSQGDAAGPAPQGLYAQGTDQTIGDNPIALRTWRPNVRFLSGTLIDRGEENAPIQEGEIPAPLPATEIILEALRPQYEAIKQQVRDAMNQDPGEGGTAPTMGIIGRNDCAQWARSLQGLITAAHNGPEQVQDFDFGGGAVANLDNAPAPLQVGDQMNQQLGEGAGSGHHGATIVATDGGHVVTLEAHVEQNLGQPAFHIYQGLPGFVDNNNRGVDGDNQYLEANGRHGQIKRVGGGFQARQNRIDMLEHYAAGLASENTDERLGAIQGSLRFYEGVLNNPLDAIEEVQVENHEDAEAEAPRRCCCFLTTACTQARGLPDDCEELTVLRQFRDGYVAAQADGLQIINHYYACSPQIVDRINQSPNKFRLYEEIYWLIRLCIQAIHDQELELALRLYQKMVLDLIEYFEQRVVKTNAD